MKMKFKRNTNEPVSLEVASAFFRWLQGKAELEGFMFDKKLNLSPEDAFRIIYVLQEGLQLIPDTYEMCAGCHELYDSDEEGTEHNGKYYCDACDLSGNYVDEDSEWDEEEDNVELFTDIWEQCVSGMPGGLIPFAIITTENGDIPFTAENKWRSVAGLTAIPVTICNDGIYPYKDAETTISGYIYLQDGMNIPEEGIPISWKPSMAGGATDLKDLENAFKTLVQKPYSE